MVLGSHICANRLPFHVIGLYYHEIAIPWRFKATCGHVKYSAKALQPSAYARAFSLRCRA